ncbi:uncharacterized protein C2845_PM04G08330 [Panicum miliaceum]|uniref:J domain-containing protein n=1 Tax=Panicum miliaceum TaxID=4540 RepID=A0A3L6QRK4_PANMI|nr:uncharacterized protein C2845_PM04G08330 [Panicum miliaceum]
MECNKEEALRAKDLAVIKLQEADYAGAKRIALKAQKLFPSLENISQLLTVCEVHCRAAVKINGEMDWYGILQVETTADDILLKKQYRKLALLLHPDKFADAEAAFKLIGEAHMILTDQVKCLSHNSKRNPVTATSAPLPKKRGQPSNKTDYVAKRANKENTDVGYSTFWTICLACGTKYHYPCSFLMKVLCCQICSMSFIAYDLSKKPSVRVEASHPWSGIGMQQQMFPPSQQTHVNNQQHNYHSVPNQQNPVTGHRAPVSNQQQQPQNVTDKQTPGIHQQQRSQKLPFSSGPKNVDSHPWGGFGMKQEFFPPNQQPNVTDQKLYYQRATGQQNPVNGHQPPVTDQNQEPLKVADKQTPVITQQQQSQKFSFSSGSKNVVNSQYAACPNSNAAASSNLTAEAQVCNSTKVSRPSFNDQNGEDRTEPPVANSDKVPLINEQIGVKEVATGSSYHVAVNDPDFYDFENNRDADRFAVDQIWAIYDDDDGMPRYYARIKQVYSPNFMLRFTSLEHDPLYDAEKAWSSKELPVACGSFRLGRTILIEDTKMFSHVVSWTKGRKRNSYEIYPKKGEVWALFKGWDISWSSDSHDHRPYDYDVVEIASDFATGSGTYVIPLVKIKGFVSLFVRSCNEAPFLIPSGDTLRFSHSIPFHRLAQTDRKHIPNGALELDTASLPPDLEKAFTTCQDGAGTNVQDEVEKLNQNTKSKQDNGSEASVIDDHCGDGWDDSSQPESPTSFDYPDPEFCNFTSLRSFDKFKKGQVWALYCDTDKFPKYYGFIKSIDADDCTIHIKWLEHCPCAQMEKRLVQDGLPIGCGAFKVSRQSDIYDCTNVFSHSMEVTLVSKGKKYEILPRVGQVWALYKDWSRAWTFEDYSRCEYILAEVLEISNGNIAVSCLTKVEGFSTVFKPEKKGESRSAMSVAKSDLIT